MNYYVFFKYFIVIFTGRFKETYQDIVRIILETIRFTISHENVEYDYIVTNDDIRKWCDVDFAIYKYVKRSLGETHNSELFNDICSSETQLNARFRHKMEI